MSPSIIGMALRRVREVFTRSRLSAEHDEEFAFHLDMEVENNVRQGMTADEARRAAHLAFGSRERFRAEVRERRGFATLTDVIRDLRLGWRRMHRAPAFTFGVVITLGIGIGAAVGVGGIVHGVLIRELPYPNASALVRVSLDVPGRAATGDLHSNATYAQLTTAQLFDGFAAWYTNDGITLTGDGNPERATAAMITPGAFDLLGVRPLLGTVFSPGDTAWGDGVPVIISEELWQRRYGSDPDIVGKAIDVNRGTRRVIGVLPGSFDFPGPDVRIWYPLSLDLSQPSLDQRYLHVAGRLRAGVTASEAQAELNTLVASLPARFPQISPQAVRSSGAQVTLQPLKSWMIADVRGQLVLLGIMVAVVLLIASTNVANLFLLRTERGAHEIAVALSLGASRGAIARRFVLDGMVLGLVSVLAALPIAGVILSSRLGLTPGDIARLNEVRFDTSAAASVLAVALFVGVVIGLAVFTRAISDGVSIADRLRSGTRATGSARWRRAQQALVATQVAFALALLVSAALLGRSFDNLRKAELGFRATGATTFEVSLPYRGYASNAEASAFHARVSDALRALPGVTGVAVATRLPLDPAGMSMPLQATRADGAQPDRVSISPSVATADYFAVMGIPLLRGRSFLPGDLRRAAPAVVLSHQVARALFGANDPVGRSISIVSDAREARMFEVVGVAGDVPGARIEDGASPMAYFPLLPDGDGLGRGEFPLPLVPRTAQYVVRGTVLPSVAQIRSMVSMFDARVPAMQVRPIAQVVAAASARVRLTMLLLSVASVGALLLGIVGVYSVVAYAVEGRSREFGVRLALGASPGRVAVMVFGDGFAMAVTGIVAGVVVAAAGTRLLQSLLYEVSATSIVEFTVAAALVAVVTVVATAIPARRAARTDPAVVLRGE